MQGTNHHSPERFVREVFDCNSEKMFIVISKDYNQWGQFCASKFMNINFEAFYCLRILLTL